MEWSRARTSRSRIARTAAVLFASLSVTALAASGEEMTKSPENPPAPLPAAITPPHLVGEADVLYPPGAHGDAVVVLELVVDQTGTVVESRAVSGEAPFADVAVTRSRTFRFEPARRLLEPVRARIRFVVRFIAPAPPPTPETETAPTAPPVVRSPETPSSPSGGVEVEVEGDRPETAVSRLGRAEVRQMPGAFGDPFRAIEALPGVTPIVSGLPYFFIRGAPPGNVGYFIDGVRVPLLYHVAAGPAVIHPALIEKVDLYPGGYPARYGRFAGGIVAGETRAPANELHGEASLRLVDAGGLIEAPLFGNRVTGLVSGRYGYPGLILPLFAPEAILQYWDYQARAAVDVGTKSTVSVFALGAYDFLGTRRRDGTVDIGFATEFHRVDLRFDHRFSPATNVRVAVTTGFDRTRANNGLYVRDRLIGTRAELEHVMGPHATLRAGADLMLDVFDVGVANEDTDTQTLARLVPSRTDVTTGVWTDVVLRVAPRVRVTPGLRTDLYVFGEGSSVGVDPRISAEFDVSRSVRLLHAVGVAHQPPSFIVPIPGIQIGRRRLQTSLQHSFGVETKLPGDFLGTVTGFHNVAFDLTDALGSSASGNGLGSDQSIEEQIDNRTLGSTIGVEVYIRRPLTRRLGGFLAYTLSRSTRSGGNQSVFVSNFDRTHVLQIAGAYDLGRRWRAGARAMLYTGIPDRSRSSAESGGFSSPITGSGGSPAPVPVASPRSSERLPAFYRLDVRLEKRWSLGERGYWAFVFEVLNTTLTKEYVERDTPIGPVTIPSIGIEASF